MSLRANIMSEAISYLLDIIEIAALSEVARNDELLLRRSLTRDL